MSGAAWKFVGGPNDGEFADVVPAAKENEILHDGCRYVVRHHDRILLFHATDEAMEERAILKRRERTAGHPGAT